MSLASPPPWLAAPFLLQGIALSVDEGWFHRRRGLPTWERIGHPLDTLSFGISFLWLVAQPPSSSALTVFVVLAALSCLAITKDEFVHSRLCCAAENWLHAILFVLHPIVLGAAGWFWWSGAEGPWLTLQLAAIGGFFIWQVGYWGPWNRKLTLSHRT